MNNDLSDSAFISSEGVSSQWQDIRLLQSRRHSVLYRAKRYGRWFILKGLPAEQQHLTDCRRLQEKEFRLGIQLVHPNIVATYSLEDIPGCGRCIVLEAVDGQTLDSWFATRPDKQKRLRVMMQLLDAVEYLHAWQLVHHDLKPGNILITHNGENLKLIDFGLSDTDDSASPSQNDIQSDLCRLADIIVLFRLPVSRRIITKCRQRKYRNISALRRDIVLYGKWLHAFPVVVIVTILLGCIGWLGYTIQEQKAMQQALEQQKQTVLADVSALCDREETRLRQIVNWEKYREFATMKFFKSSRYVALRDSLNTVYPPDDVMLNYFCNTTLDNWYNSLQSQLYEQFAHMPTMQDELRAGYITPAEYDSLMQAYAILCK